MKFEDSVYGTFEINEWVLTGLINSSIIQDLKGVRHGLPIECSSTDSPTSYDHAVGTMALLRIFRQSLELQVAGLLYAALTNTIPTPHSILSMVPYVPSEIAHILSKHQYKTKRIRELMSHPLIMSVEPDLTAVRLDFALREFVSNPRTERPMGYLYEIMVPDDTIYFLDQESAYSFAMNYVTTMSRGCYGVENTLRRHVFSDMLEEAIHTGVMTGNDVNKGATNIIEKLKKAKNGKIGQALEILSKNIELSENRDNLQTVLSRSFDYVDPWVVQGGSALRLTDLSYKYKTFIRRLGKIHQKGIKADLVTKQPQLRIAR